MTKKEFLKRAADAEEFWNFREDGSLEWTCDVIAEHISKKASDNFYEKFFSYENSSICALWNTNLLSDSNFTMTIERLNTCRVMYFQLWVYRVLESKAYRGF